MRTRRVVKLGGSLLDLPDLSDRLAWFIGSCSAEDLLWVVGGGRAADGVREFDALHKIGDEAAHWMAVRAMQLNSVMIACILPDASLVGGRNQAEEVWQRRCTPVADPVVWLQNDEGTGRAVPHCWAFTSDSIAAHMAIGVGAERLTLLKSTIPSSDCPAAHAAKMGVVDDEFERAAVSLSSVELVNLRGAPPQCLASAPDRTQFRFQRCVLR